MGAERGTEERLAESLAVLCRLAASSDPATLPAAAARVVGDALGAACAIAAATTPSGGTPALAWARRGNAGVAISLEGRADADLTPAERRFLATAEDVLTAALRAAPGADRAVATRDEYRRLVESIPIVTYVDRQDELSSALFVSPQIEQLLGYTTDDWLTQEDLFVRILHPDDRERIVAALRDFGPWSHEYRLVARDGSVVWVHDESRRETLPDGTAVWLGYLIDISERKRAEAERADAEERFRHLIEELPLITYLEGPGDDFPTHYMSPQVEQILGYPPDALTGSGDRFYAHVHPDDREAVRRHTRSAMHGIVESEYRMVAADGRVVWFLDRSIPHRDEHGDTVEVRGFLLDVTDRRRIQSEREVAEARYRALVEELPGVVYVDEVDERPAARYVSPRIERLLGYTAAEIVADPDLWLSTIVHPDDRDLVLEAIRTNIEGRRANVEYRCVGKDGRIVWVQDESVPEVDATGKVIAHRGYLQDVSQRKLIEAERQEAEERYRTLVEEMPGVVYVDEADETPTTRYISPRVERMVGYTADEIVGSPGFWERRVVHPDDRDRVLADIRRNLAGERTMVEYRCVAKDGSIVWVFDQTFPQFDEGGKLATIRGYLWDITQRRLVEQERQAAEDRYRVLVEEMPAVVYVDAADEFGSTLYMNRKIEEILGYSLEEWQSDPSFFVDRVLHPDDREWLLASIAANNRGEANSCEYRCLAKDGRLVWIWDESIPQVDEHGHVVATRGFMVDVTARKLAEEELKQRDGQLRQVQKMEAIGRLAGGVAHDFNNLLTVIIGYVDLMTRIEGLDDHLAVPLAEVSGAAQRAATLTRQLLAFSRQQMLKPEVLDLADVVSGLGLMLRRLLGERVNLVVQSAAEPATVHVDRGQIEQVVVNLAVNARDALPDGGTITIETRTLPAAHANGHGPGGKLVELTVSDTGAGLDEDTRNRIFEPFFTTKAMTEGTGLGLSIVHGIVEQSGGTIEVESLPGEGTTFRILLPHVPAPSERTDRVVPELRAPSPGTVLLVEDDTSVRTLVRRTLRRAGYTVIEARDPEHAVAIAARAETTIDILLTDVVMPGMNGRELAEQLERVRPGTPALLMSGYTDDEIVRHGISRASTSFIQKPFAPAVLVAKIDEVVDAARATTTVG